MTDQVDQTQGLEGRDSGSFGELESVDDNRIHCAVHAEYIDHNGLAFIYLTPKNLAVGAVDQVWPNFRAVATRCDYSPIKRSYDGDSRLSLHCVLAILEGVNKDVYMSEGDGV